VSLVKAARRSSILQSSAPLDVQELGGRELFVKGGGVGRMINPGHRAWEGSGKMYFFNFHLGILLTCSGD